MHYQQLGLEPFLPEQPCDGACPAVELPGFRHVVYAQNKGQAACEERVLELRVEGQVMLPPSCAIVVHAAAWEDVGRIGIYDLTSQSSFYLRTQWLAVCLDTGGVSCSRHNPGQVASLQSPSAGHSKRPRQAPGCLLIRSAAQQPLGLSSVRLMQRPPRNVTVQCRTTGLSTRSAPPGTPTRVKKCFASNTDLERTEEVEQGVIAT